MQNLAGTGGRVSALGSLMFVVVRYLHFFEILKSVGVSRQSRAIRPRTPAVDFLSVTPPHSSSNILLALWVYYSIHWRSSSCAPPCCSQPLATFMHGCERPKHATWRSNLEIIFFITAPRSLSWGRFQGVSVLQLSPGKIQYFCMF